MNVQVKHNGTNITTSVISYEREHKICSSIGLLDVVLEGTYNTSIDPWDTVDIYENGDYKVRYYVSEVSHSVPDGTITLQCQDKSKRLVDYFIPDSYTVEEPTFTRYWIEKFLNEAGIDYSFVVASQGNLLSNYTSLGLQSAYDQIMMLLQLSGWYMYFDGDGVAVIGSLDIELSDSAGTLEKVDILDIKKITNDKMLRNRAVVWGQYDSLRQEYAYADVSTHTKWNYDHRDLRAAVVSNSNIPNKTSAFNIANVMLKEFSKGTIEKHITAHGARDYVLGNSIIVKSNIWRGKGLITTFGVAMDRSGLVTNIVLDERCPRLFGFFDFGDYVYVGTFGDGVWRKHIRYDPTWYDFSSGFIDMNITDLHINQGVFGAVTMSGQAYYTNEESNYWQQVDIPKLESSVEDVISGGGVATSMKLFSGIVARGTIVDKLTNVVKFGVDTSSGLNYGDYFLDNYEHMTTGIVYSGIQRSWILEYDPFSGTLLDDHPVHYSGFYSMEMLDIENNGSNDFVSVRVYGTSNPDTNTEDHNYGHHYTQPILSNDPSSWTIAPVAVPTYLEEDGHSSLVDMPVINQNSLIAIDDGITGYRACATIGNDRKGHFISWKRVLDENTNEWLIEIDELIESTDVCPDIDSNTNILGIYTENWGNKVFRIYYEETAVVGDYADFKMVEWDAYHDEWSVALYLGTYSLDVGYNGVSLSTLAVNEKIYALLTLVRRGTLAGGWYRSPSYMQAYLATIDMATNSFSSSKKFEFISTEKDDGFGAFSYFSGGLHGSASSDGPTGFLSATICKIFRNGNDVQILGRFEVYTPETPFDNTTNSKEYVIVGNESLLQWQLIYDAEDYRFGSGTTIVQGQLTANKAFIGLAGTGGDVQPDSKNSFVLTTDGYSVFAGEYNSIPFNISQSQIRPILNDGDIYIAVDYDGNFWKCLAATCQAEAPVTLPANTYMAAMSSSTTGTFVSTVYAILVDTIEYKYHYVPFDGEQFYRILEFNPYDYLYQDRKTINFGNIFIQEPVDYSSFPTMRIIYYDMGLPGDNYGTFLVLRRRDEEYDLIDASLFPRRIDISNSNPVLIVASGEMSFISDFVYDTQLTSIAPPAPIGIAVNSGVRDYRYTLLETVSGIISSGVGVTNQLLYLTGSGIYTADVATYSGGFILMDTVPSGLAERIETSNYTYPGQYIFVTTSGDFPSFYQRDNDSMFFDSYSGLPQSRATIIRVDDRF